MYWAVSRWVWAASAVTTALSRSTASSNSLTWVVSVVSSGMRCWAMITFSSCSIAANSFTCPSATPRSHFPSIAIALSSPSNRPASTRARSQPPTRSSRASAPMAWTRVRIRVSLGTVIRRSSGCGLPSSRASTSCGRSAAWSPISRKLFAPASTHATATASRNTRPNLRPRLLRGSRTCASTSSRPGASPSVLVMADSRACDTDMDGLLFRSDQDSVPVIMPG